MYEISSAFMQNLILPIILAVCGSIVYLIKKAIDKVTAKIDNKNEIEMIQKTNALKQQLLAEVQKTVETAVSVNMPKADAFKEENGGKLSEEQIEMLKESARNLTYAMLPNSMTEEDGVLLKSIGNKTKLDIFIDNYIEKSTYDYKFKKNQ